MLLLYVNELGPDYKGERLYEFIFGENNEGCGEDWDLKPAAGRPKPPELHYIKVVGQICDTTLKFELVQNSDYFSCLDAVDDVIALAWESYDEGEPEEDDVKRLVFRFGESLETIKQKLKGRNLDLKIKVIK